MILCRLIGNRGGFIGFPAVLAIVLLCPTTSPATTLNYSVLDLGGGSWQYDYSIINDSLADPIQEFTIYFDLGLYENLIPVAAPAGWDPLVVQPDPGLSSDGFFDALELGSGLPPGGTAGVFSVSFNYLGTGTPGNQPFDVVDPASFNILDSGFTSVLAPPPPPPPGVPEPGTLAIMTLGLGLLAGYARRLRKSNDR